MKIKLSLLLLLLFTMTLFDNSNSHCFSQEYIDSITNSINTETMKFLKNDKANKVEICKAMSLYKEFLKGNITVNSINMEYLATPTGEPEKRKMIQYGFFDSNGDGIPELHIYADRRDPYFVFTVKNNKMEIWLQRNPYYYYFPLDNGAFMNCDGSSHFESFNIEFYNNSACLIYEISFYKNDTNRDGIYDEDDEYIFDDVYVTKEQYEKLISKFIYTDGNESIPIYQIIELYYLFDDWPLDSVIQQP